MTDPTAAAERLRRLANAKQAMPISNAANMVREFTNSFIAGDEPVKHQNTMELFQANLVLAGAWLDEHADDDAELITEEWVRSIAPRYWEAGRESYWPEYGLRFAEKIGNNLGGFYFWNEGPRSHMQEVAYIKGITTRGQLRLLLRAMGQEPQP